jgi:hypothetical protein
MITIISALFFLGIEGDNIVRIMRARPSWGIYVASLLIAGFGIVFRWAVDGYRNSGSLLSITESGGEKRERSYRAAGYIWLVASAVAVVWLSRIASESAP